VPIQDTVQQRNCGEEEHAMATRCEARARGLTARLPLRPYTVVSRCTHNRTIMHDALRARAHDTHPHATGTIMKRNAASTKQQTTHGRGQAHARSRRIGAGPSVHEQVSKAIRMCPHVVHVASLVASCCDSPHAAFTSSCPCRPPRGSSHAVTRPCSASSRRLGARPSESRSSARTEAPPAGGRAW